MKLNLGCGENRLEGFLNLDIRKEVNPDIICDVKKLPFKDDSVEEICAFDVLEHFEWFDVIDVLKEWFRVLKKGGILTIRVPDINELFRFLVSPPEVYEDDWIKIIRRLSALIYGNQDYEQNYHKACFNKAYFEAIAKKFNLRILDIHNTKTNLVIILQK